MRRRRTETAPDASGYERQARDANHGVRELRVLPGQHPLHGL
jgi:hypothetical protein